jgi:predicted HicB family RNase H-like nuclease
MIVSKKDKKFIDFSLRLPPETHKIIKASAFEQQRSLHGHILFCIAEYLKHHPAR